MMEGFKPILDECSLTYGQLDSPEEDPGIPTPVTVDTERRTFEADAVGIDEVGEGRMVVMLFDWVTFDKEVLIREARKHDIEVDDELEEELDVIDGETTMYQKGFVPWHQVRNIEMTAPFL